MELNEHNLYRYQNGFMSIDEILDFEQLLEENPQFMDKALISTQTVHKIITHNHTMYQTILSEAPRQVWYKLPIVVLAASLGIMIGGVWVFLNITRPQPSLTQDWSLLVEYADASAETKRFAGPSVPVETDSLCNCQLNLRNRFENDPDNLAIFLQTWQPQTPSQQQCKLYWVAWTALFQGNQVLAKSTFAQLYHTTPHNQVRQRAMIGYMKVLIYQKDLQVFEVANQLLKEEKLWDDTFQLASQIQKVQKFD